jgi:hypothetical protein
VIKIRYSDLPAGVHASARSEGRHTVLYLVPGLSAADRHGAIDRLRASARVGHGPELPAISLALALIADRIRLNLRNAAAAARLHPIGAAIPVLLLAGGAILYALFVTVTIRIGPPSAQAALAPRPAPASAAPAAAGPAAASPGGSGGADPAGADPAAVSRLTGARSGPPASHRGGTAPGQVAGAHPAPSSAPAPSPDPSTSSPPPGHHTSPPPGSPSPSPTPSPTRSHGGGGACLNLGPLGICLNV